MCDDCFGPVLGPAFPPDRLARYDRRKGHHCLATGKALTLRPVQGEGGFTAQVGLSGWSRHAQRLGGTQQFLDILAAQGVRTVFVQKQPL